MKTKKTASAKGYDNAVGLQRLGIEPLSPPSPRVASVDGQMAIPGVDLWEIELEHLRAARKGKRSAREDSRQGRLWG